MKKTVLAILFGAFAVASTANANWYGQVDVGYSKLKVEDLKGSSFSPSLTVGYDFGDYRIAVDYTNYGKIKETSQVVGGVASSELKAYGLGVSAIYDINLGQQLTPYVGARLAANYLSHKEKNPTDNSTVKSGNIGYGAVAGVQYNFTPNFLLNAGVEYNKLGSADGDKVNQYGAKVGLRLNF